MPLPEHEPAVPNVFVLYSSDDVGHEEWVERLVARMRGDAIDVTLGRWHMAHGEEIPAFTDRAVRENDFVIAICTPRFKESSEMRAGGMGYEAEIMASRAVSAEEERKFIPVLRRGLWTHATPSWLPGPREIDLSEDPYSESEYKELLRTLRVGREPAPPMTGPVPDYFQGEGDDALRSRVVWLKRQAGFEDAFFPKYLRLNESTFRLWFDISAPLPTNAVADLYALWRTVQHVQSFLNFDSQRVKTLLHHQVPGVSSGFMTKLAPPWAGSSLIEYLKEHGPNVLLDVDRWLTALRFGDPYVGVLARTSHLQTAHAG